MPMTFDTYSLCSYRCQYCFSFYQRIHSKDYEQNNARFVNVEKVKRLFTDPDSSQFGKYIKKRIPMQWGGLSEPFDPTLEPKLGVGLKLLKFFREIDYPVSFSTKATWWTRDEKYLDVIRGAKNFHFKFSIITLDEAKYRIIEQAVPTPEDRLKALEVVAGLGTAGVNLRLRPFMIGVSNPTHGELIRRAAAAGAQALTTEFFCLEARVDLRVKKRYQIMSEACGFNLWDFYKKNSRGMQGYLRLNYEIKRPFVEEMQDLCKEVGMGFFVSDAHHKEKCVKADGCRWGSCCGLPDDEYFSNYAKCQFTEALTFAKEKGEVKFTDITKFDTDYLRLPWKKAQGLNKLTVDNYTKNFDRSLYDMMRYSWNHPMANNSPYRYFGKMLIPTGLDENGDMIYRFNQAQYDNRSKK